MFTATDRYVTVRFDNYAFNSHLEVGIAEVENAVARSSEAYQHP
jgi:hypothetical protein